MDSDGDAHFVDDIYGEDAQLERGCPYPTKG